MNELPNKYETGPNERTVVYELDEGGAGKEIWVINPLMFRSMHPQGHSG